MIPDSFVVRVRRLFLVVIAAGALVAGIGTAPSASAQPAAGVLRVASAFDPQTMDPHAVTLLYHTRVVSQIYEALVGRDARFRIEPALALAWQMTGPTTWRFRLRPQVRFHDGSTLDADDVVFSIERALARPSQRAFQLQGVVAARKVDALTVDIVLDAPDAVLPEKLQYVAIMSRAWSEKHGVERAQDIHAREDTHAVRHANGTGPMKLLSYEPERRTTLERHDAWWGWVDRRNGNLRGARFVTIRSESARLAALAAGEVDLVLDPPVQDIARLKTDARLTLVQTPDLGQQYLTFDQWRDELVDGDVKGRNPFRDLRVRKAVYHALNMPLIIDKVLRGQAQPTGAFLSPLIDDLPAGLDQRLPYNPALARQLLGQAGYPNGFAVTLDCLAVSWRENVCQAMAAMLTQVGIRTRLRPGPGGEFFPRLTQAHTSLVEFGWTATPDPWHTLNALFRSHDPAGGGAFNAGRYSNPKVDVLIDRLRNEPDLTRRRAMVATVLRLVAEDLPYIPLYRRTLSWAMSKRVNLVPWPNDTLELRWVTLR